MKKLTYLLFATTLFLGKYVSIAHGCNDEDDQFRKPPSSKNINIRMESKSELQSSTFIHSSDTRKKYASYLESVKPEYHDDFICVAGLLPQSPKVEETLKELSTLFQVVTNPDDIFHFIYNHKPEERAAEINKSYLFSKFSHSLTLEVFSPEKLITDLLSANAPTSSKNEVQVDKNDPSDACKTYALAGNAAFINKEHETALSRFEMAMKKNQNLPPILYNNASMSAVHLKLFEKALKYSKLAISKALPNVFWELYLNAAYAASNLEGREKEALDFYKLLFEMKPDQIWDKYAIAAYMAYKLKDYDLALKYYRKTFAINPKAHYQTYTLAATAAFHLGFYLEACKYAEIVINDPSAEQEVKESLSIFFLKRIDLNSFK